jgi:trimethylamine:corrinoid methyltransferase-like protein
MMTVRHTTDAAGPATASTRRVDGLPLRHLDVLPETTLERIHAATLQVLDRTGIEVRSDAMIRRLAAAGAGGDVETRRVTFPPGLVEERLALAPNTLALAGRDPACDLHLDGTYGCLSVDGNAAEILDLVPASGGARRRRIWHRFRAWPTRSRRSGSSGRGSRRATCRSRCSRSTSSTRSTPTRRSTCS